MATATGLPIPDVVRTSPDDRDRSTATLVAAFVGDPLIRWMLPEPAQYLATFPEVLRHFAGGAFDHDSGYRTDDYTGAALWLPPGIAPDEEALGEVMATGIGDDRRDDVFALMEQVDACHPDVEHWYLPAIGVDPAAQGRGIGSLLLARALADIDREPCTAYLESSNPRNVPLYERFGFRIVAEIQAGSSPTIVPMVRDPRAGG